MKTILRASLLAAAVLAAACVSGPQVRVDQDPAADMRSYKTFAFFDQAGADHAYRSIMTARLMHATRERMEAMGYMYQEANPDLRVNFILKVKDKQEIRSAPTGMGMGPARYRGWSQSIEAVNYKEGTLRIDLVDPKTRTQVWQGVAEGQINEKEARQPGPAVDAVVKQILAGLEKARGA